ncbi:MULTISPECIES: hypothetical protein [Streptomyces]|uniref:hypothetical protein n=1 Tax=Streptomyces TaxID=1883 RepID=UPI0004CB0839|nr:MULTISPECIES: hypothetical protein [Streptomyces]
MTPTSGPPVATSLPVASGPDLTRVRQRIRRAAAGLGLGPVRQAEPVTAAGEPARTTLAHGGGGHVEIAPVTRGAARGPRLSLVDSGPGVHDVEPATTDGHTSGGGPGRGLSGARRLVHACEPDTEPGRGAPITVVARTADVPAARSGAW